MNDRAPTSEAGLWAERGPVASECDRALRGAIDGGIVQLDGRGRIVAVDGAFLELVGRDRIDVVGEPATAVLAEPDVDRFDDAIRSLEDDGGLALDVDLEHADRPTVSTTCRLRSIGSDGSEDGAVAIFRERESMASEPNSNRSTSAGSESITTILEDAEIGVFVLDDEFDVAWTNEAAERYFGFDRSDVLGRDKRRLIDELVRHRLEEPETFADTVCATYDDNSYVERFECRVTPGDGREERWLEHRSKPIESGLYAGGRIELYYDVTDQRRRAYQLRRLHEAVAEWLEGDSREAVAERAAVDIRDVLGLEINGIHLYQPETERLRPVAVSKPAAELFEQIPAFGEGEGIAWRVFESGDPAVYTDVRADPDVFNSETPIRSEICLSLGEHGVVTIGSEQRGAFDDADLSIAKIAASSLEATFDRIRHEQTIERERTQTEQLLRMAPAAITVEDDDGEIVLTNERTRNVLGIETPANGDGRSEPRPPLELEVYDVGGDPLDPAETPSTRVRRTGEPVFDVELFVEGNAGDRTWLSVNAAPLFDADGELDRVVTVSEDITTRKEHERRLERKKSELETELSEILGRVSDAFYAIDEEWTFTHINDRAAELVGHPDGDVLGRKIWDVHPDDDGTIREQFHRAMASQKHVEFEASVDAVDRWFEVTAYPSKTGLSVYFRDVTRRKERERELLTYETIVETVEDGIYVIDECDRFTAVNEAYAELTGYAPGQLLEEHVSIVADEEVVALARTTAASEADDSTIEAELETKGGDRIPIEATVTTVADGLENGAQRVGVVRDITERKARRQQLEESNERLEQFAYAASHDLQEPLRMISSYLRLIDRRYGDRLDEDGQEFLNYAVDGADRMTEMIEGLLEYSRVETQGDPLEPTDLEAVLEDVLQDLQFRIAECDAEITAEPLPTVRGDRGQLRQVVQNLLSNALEYSGDDPPQVRIRAERSGSEWVISVRDDGVGIESAETDRIFEVFQRLHSHEEHAGTGIGLALCQRIVERHGGRIWVDAEPGEGSTFSFTVPAVGRANA
ncbi:PAS domain S-box protein [Natrarchaeobius sp. A-rgal3]|uniref:PAS domain S-box protein n=1 Tax=Natrarchaeobius versutus TaxID=1679078 RepID=UPI00350F233A